MLQHSFKDVCLKTPPKEWCGIHVFEANYFYLRFIVQFVILVFDELFLFNFTTMDNQHVTRIMEKKIRGSFYYKSTKLSFYWCDLISLPCV